MGAEQLEGKDQQNQKRIVVKLGNAPAKMMTAREAFENAPVNGSAGAVQKRTGAECLKTHQCKETHPCQNAFEIAPMRTRADLYWLAYQRGWQDAMKKKEAYGR